MACCRVLSRPTHTERYRSGRNGGASKASCRVTGTGVRIPPSPPHSLAPARSCGGSEVSSSRRRAPIGAPRAWTNPSPRYSHALARSCGGERGFEFTPHRPRADASVSESQALFHLLCRASALPQTPRDVAKDRNAIAVARAPSTSRAHSRVSLCASRWTSRRGRPRRMSSRSGTPPARSARWLRSRCPSPRPSRNSWTTLVRGTCRGRACAATRGFSNSASSPGATRRATSY
jgi:hypothetical protein